MDKLHPSPYYILFYGGGFFVYSNDTKKGCTGAKNHAEYQNAKSYHKNHSTKDGISYSQRWPFTWQKTANHNAKGHLLEDETTEIMIKQENNMQEELNGSIKLKKFSLKTHHSSHWRVKYWLSTTWSVMSWLYKLVTSYKKRPLGMWRLIRNCSKLPDKSKVWQVRKATRHILINL